MSPEDLMDAQIASGVAAGMTEAEALSAFLAKLETGIAAKVKELSKTLAALLHDVPTDWPFIKERIFALTENPLEELRSNIFEELCEWIGKAYGEEPTDAEILAAPGTVDLVRS